MTVPIPPSFDATLNVRVGAPHVDTAETTSEKDLLLLMLYSAVISSLLYRAVQRSVRHVRLSRVVDIVRGVFVITEGVRRR